MKGNFSNNLKKILFSETIMGLKLKLVGIHAEDIYNLAFT